jgi:4-(gamma-glutamylamino)butanal dehydrogenase
MNELLTLDEYRAIAAGLDLPTNAFINGRYQAPVNGATMDTVNPATGKTLARVPACDVDDVDLAVTKAREAFERGAWSRMPRASARRR